MAITADKTEWQTLREEHDAAWEEYQKASFRVHALYDELHSGEQDQTPANEDLTWMQEAWKRLVNARERMDDYLNTVGS
ncbi:hypothetical protein QQM79_15990 [Marinobacteraceae bacterium S3BR75-40.1]